MSARLLEGLDGIPVPADPCTVASRDACVVEVDGLATLVEAFVSSYVRVRRSALAATDDRLGALDALTDRTKAQDPAGVGIPRQTIRNVAQRRYRHVELRTADAIVTAVHQPFAYYDGTLTIRPNPRVRGSGASGLCCGSSLNGSLSQR